MTSEERREARYRRRQERRRENLRKRNAAVGTLAEVFSYHKLFFHGRKCCNGVRWKQSTQNFERHLFSGTATRRRKILKRKWRPGKTASFWLKERGKNRPINAPHIRDRQVEKTHTKEVLEPLYRPSMIYDNGASQKGKGLSFHYERLKKHLRDHFRKYGLNGGIDMVDFKGYFPNAPRWEICARHERIILDPEIREIADAMVNVDQNERGMFLGVEPSQQEMVALPSSLDNYLKCQLSIHGMEHYMDDYNIKLPTMEEARQTMEDVTERAERMGIEVKRKKSKVVSIAKPFRFCKVKFQLTETGRVITHGCRDSMKRARRKLKKFKGKVDAGEMTVNQVEEWLQGQISYFENFNDHGRVLRLRRLFYAIYKGGKSNV